MTIEYKKRNVLFMELFVVRDGQTDWNKLRKIQGRSNRHIIPEGVNQIKETSRQLEGIKFDAVYVSPLDRAVQTAEILCNSNDFIIDERIIEIAFGELEGLEFNDLKTKDKDELSEKEKKIVKFFRHADIYEPTPGGESYEELLERIEEFFSDMKKKHSGEKVLVVSHATVIHGMLLKVLERPITRIWDVFVPNGAITKFVERDGKLFLDSEIIERTDFF